MLYKQAIIQGVFEAFPVSSSLLINKFDKVISLIDLPIAISSLIYFSCQIRKYIFYALISTIPILFIGGIIKIYHLEMIFPDSINRLLYIIYTILLLFTCNKEYKMTIPYAILIGIFQSFSSFNTISRLGSVLLVSNLTYAWIISIPTFIFKSLFEIFFQHQTIDIVSLMIIGSIFYCMLHLTMKMHYKYYIYLILLMRCVIFILYL